MENEIKLLFLGESNENKLFQQLNEFIKTRQYNFDFVELEKLDFQQNESIKKFINADIVVMDLTNKERRPMYIFHKGNRESYNDTEDILLIQATDVETIDEIQDLRTALNIKQLIVYYFNEVENSFYDYFNPTQKLGSTFKRALKSAIEAIKSKMADRYLKQIESKLTELENKNGSTESIWSICREIFSKDKVEHVTTKIIIRLMYIFRERQDYQSMIKLYENCIESETVRKVVENNNMISYLTAFARSRRNENDDRGKALETLKDIFNRRSETNELSNDVTCLVGRIYKDKYTDSQCQDQKALEQAIKWYQRGFEQDPNIYAGINVLSLFTVKNGNALSDRKMYEIIIRLNEMLGKRIGLSKESNDYWNVATFFELQVVLNDWIKACRAALDMFLMNPPIWYLTSTINNIKILHKARTAKREAASKENEELYDFWIDFFCDAIKSSSEISENLTAEIPILICDTIERTDQENIQLIYIEAHLELNFQTEDGKENIVIRSVKSKRFPERTFLLTSIQVLKDVKGDNRSLFFFGYDQSEEFSSPLQICFSSSIRRTNFNAKISNIRQTTNSIEPQRTFDLDYHRNRQGYRICVGRGTYGNVYVATDHKTGKLVAVKEVLIRNPLHMEILENEVKILSRLDHKNIVNYEGTNFEVVNRTQRLQLIMDFVDGMSIQTFLEKFGPLEEKTIRLYSRRILEGLKYLHEKRILHRDIKGGNILISKYGEIKIADFGMAHRLAGLHLCKESNIGTPHFMSPDVIDVSANGYGPEVDIWSFGCTVIEMATGKPPFQSCKNGLQLMYKIATERQPPETPENLSAEGKDFLQQCFSASSTRTTAESLLKHPFVIVHGKSSGLIHAKAHLVNTSVSQEARSNEDSETNIEPTRTTSTEVSVDEERRSNLSQILGIEACRQKLLKKWIELVQDRQETDFLNEEKLELLYRMIQKHFNSSTADVEIEFPPESLPAVDDREARFDLEQAFYLFIRAANHVLTESYPEAPHVAFARDNIIRTMIEKFVALIRTDFRAANLYGSRVFSACGQQSKSQKEFMHAISHQSSSSDDTSDLPKELRMSINQYEQKLKELLDFRDDLKTRISIFRQNSLTPNWEVLIPPPSPMFLPTSGAINGEALEPATMFPPMESPSLKRHRGSTSFDEDESVNQRAKKHHPTIDLSKVSVTK